MRLQDHNNLRQYGMQYSSICTLANTLGSMIDIQLWLHINSHHQH